MGLFGAIAKRPKTTLAIWIIVTLIFAPFALQAMNKVIYNESKLLPQSAEYVRAQQYLEEVMPNSTEYGVGEVLVVEGMKYPSNNAENWYFTFKKLAKEKGYVNNTFSIYDIMNETMRGIKENITFLYDQIYNGTLMAKNGIYLLNSTLNNITSQLKALYLNVSALYNASVSLVPVYSQICSSLKGAYKNALMLQKTILGLTQMYKGVIDKANLTYSELLNATESLKTGLMELDQNYTSLYYSLEKLHSEMTLLRTSVSSVNYLAYGVEEALQYSYFNVMRAHFYLLRATQAYQKGLTRSDIELVENLTNLTKYGMGPVPSQIIEATWKEVEYLTGGNASKANDTTLLGIALQIAEEEIKAKVPAGEYTMASYFLENYTKDFEEEYVGWASQNGALLGKLVYSQNDTERMALSQVNLAKDIKKISEGALVLFSEDQNVIWLIERETKNEEVATFVLRVAINAGSPMNSTYVELSIVSFVEGMIPPNLPVNDTILRELYLNNATPEMALGILEKILEGNNEALSLIPILEKYDPKANGSIEKRNVLVEAISSIIEEKTGKEFPTEEFVSEILEGNLTSAKELLFRTFQEAFVNQSLQTLEGLGVPKKVALQAINYTIEYYEIMTDDYAFYLASKIIASAPQIGDKEGFVKALQEIRNGTPVEKVALALMAKNPKIREAGPFANLLLGVLSEVGPNGTPREVWNASIAQILKMAPPGANLTAIFPIIEEIYGKSPSEKYFREQAYELIKNNLKGEELELLNYTYQYGPNLSREKVEEILKKIVELPPPAIKAMKALGIEPEEFVKEVIENALGERTPVVKKYSQIAYQKIWPGIEENMTGILIGTNKRAFLVVLNTSSVKEELKAYELAKKTAPSGAKIYIVGPNLMNYEMKEYGNKDSQHVSTLSTILVLLISIAVMGSVVAVVLPFVGAGTASVMGLGTAYFLAVLGIVSLSQETNMLMLTAPLGLGVDYSVYMVYRYKLELSKGTDPIKAVEIAAKESLPGISASAFSDIIGFASLALAWDFPFMTSMGLTLPFSILYVYIASLVVVPAFLAIAKDSHKAWWPSKPSVRRLGKDSKIVKSLVRYAPIAFAATLVLGGIWAYSTFEIPTTHDWTIFLPMPSQSYQGYKAFVRDFAVGEIMPTFIVMHFSDNWTKHKETIDKIVQNLSKIEGIKKVYSPLNDNTLISKDGKTVAIEIYTKMNPLTSEGMKVVKEIEKIAHNPKYQGKGMQIYVGGVAEASRDLQEMLNKDFYHKILPIVLILMFLVLISTFQSFPIALLIMLDIFLGVFAGLAVTDWIFRGIYGVELPWFLPLAIVAVMMGVGIDYNSFYVNRVRELRREIDTKSAVIRAAGEFSPIIIGLSLIVSGAFASLLVGYSWGVKELGSSLTISVMVASIFATYFFLPIALYLLGDRIWWPRKKF